MQILRYAFLEEDLMMGESMMEAKLIKEKIGLDEKEEFNAHLSALKIHSNHGDLEGAIQQHVNAFQQKGLEKMGMPD